MLVQKWMTPDPIAATPTTSLAEALGLTRSRRIRHLPVVEHGGLVGIVSDRDIRLAMPSPLEVEDADRLAFLERMRVESIMIREVITAGLNDTVEDAARLFRRHAIGSLPVVDARGGLLGILTESDILRAFVEILGGSAASSRLEVALADRPGELARAVRLIGEELRLNITSIMVPPGRTQGNKTAIIHISTIDPREAIAALERDGFEVGWPSLEADLRAVGAPRFG